MKKTPLYDWNVKRGAVMAPFSGYTMPLWYPGGAKQEHCAVLTAAGIFDTNHMPPITVSGPQAFDLLQMCATKDLSRIGKKKAPLYRGICTNGAFLNENGGVVDDTILCLIDDDEYLVSINAGMGPVVTEHLAKYRGSLDAEIADLCERVGKIDVQGPLSAKVLWRCIEEPERVFKGMRYYRFKGHFNEKSVHADEARFTDGTPVLLSRTGYTGEFGFELFLNRARVAAVWEMIMKAGESFGLNPCGLAARDSLRAGAVLPLSHQDIGDWPFIYNPWHFALPYNDDRSGFTKDFIGRETLEKITDIEFTYPFVGYDPRKVSTHNGAAKVFDSGGNEIGTVLTCVSDMGIDRIGGRIYSLVSPDAPEGFAPRGLSCGFVKVKTRLSNGDMIVLRDSRRSIEVYITDNIRPDRSARRPIREMIP